MNGNSQGMEKKIQSLQILEKTIYGLALIKDKATVNYSNIF